MFRSSVERRSTRSWNWSASIFLAATVAPMYLMKSMPHLSHLPPWRCSLAQERHWKRSVAWQRVQNRATSRTSVAHFGHLIIGRGAGAPRSDELWAGLSGNTPDMLKFYREEVGETGSRKRCALTWSTLAGSTVRAARNGVPYGRWPVWVAPLA